MALIARLQHPYIVEFKEAWVEKVWKFRNFFFNCFFCLKFLNWLGELCRVAMSALSRVIVKVETCKCDLALWWSVFIAVLWVVFISRFCLLWQGWIDEEIKWYLLSWGGMRKIPYFVCPIEGRKKNLILCSWVMIDPQTLLKWFAQLVLAVDYLHSNYVLHRDLKVSGHGMESIVVIFFFMQYMVMLPRNCSAPTYFSPRIRTYALVSISKKI
jgi:serine/threonine protein kinase